MKRSNSKQVRKFSFLKRQRKLNSKRLRNWRFISKLKRLENSTIFTTQIEKKTQIITDKSFLKAAKAFILSILTFFRCLLTYLICPIRLSFILLITVKLDKQSLSFKVLVYLFRFILLMVFLRVIVEIILNTYPQLLISLCESPDWNADPALLQELFRDTVWERRRASRDYSNFNWQYANALRENDLRNALYFKSRMDWAGEAFDRSDDLYRQFRRRGFIDPLLIRRR